MKPPLKQAANSSSDIDRLGGASRLRPLSLGGIMKTDWKHGDLCECKADFWRVVEGCKSMEDADVPRYGEIVRVGFVLPPQFSPGGRVYLVLQEYPFLGFEAASFRRISPDQDPCSTEFDQFVKSMRVDRHAEPVEHSQSLIAALRRIIGL